MSRQENPSSSNNTKKPLLPSPQTNYSGSQFYYSNLYPQQIGMYRPPQMSMPQLIQNPLPAPTASQPTPSTLNSNMPESSQKLGENVSTTTAAVSLSLPRPLLSLPRPPSSLPPPPSSLPPPPSSLPPPPSSLPPPPSSLPPPPSSSSMTKPSSQKLPPPSLQMPKSSSQSALTSSNSDGKMNGFLKRPSKSMTIKMNLSTSASKLTTTKRPVEKKTVAEVFNDDDQSDEEDMPPEAKMRMRNIGKDTPTPSGPNSFNKTKLGFCNTARIFEKQLEREFEEPAPVKKKFY